MSEASGRGRVDLDEARDSIKVSGPPPLTDISREGTTWDKPAPTRPPGAKGVEIPPHLSEVHEFFQEIILSEGLVLELCLDQAIEMVTNAVNRRLVGTDNFTGDGDGAGGPFTPAHYAGIATPLTIELYKNVLLSIDSQKATYEKLTKRAAEKLEEIQKEAARVRSKSPVGKGSSIIIP